MIREKEHALAGQVRRLHTPDPSICGRNFRIVDWAERLTFDNPPPSLCADFIERASKGESPLNQCRSGLFSPLTYRRAVYGYLDNDESKPFLVDEDEICDIAGIMHGAFDASVNWFENRAQCLLESARGMASGARTFGGNQELETLVAELLAKAARLHELLSAGNKLLETKEGVDTITGAATVADEVWRAAMAISDAIHRQYLEYRPGVCERTGWMKHCDFYSRFGFAEGERDQPQGRHARSSVLDKLGFFLKESFELRNGMRSGSVSFSAQMNWLIAFYARPLNVSQS